MTTHEKQVLLSRGPKHAKKAAFQAIDRREMVPSFIVNISPDGTRFDVDVIRQDMTLDNVDFVIKHMSGITPTADNGLIVVKD